MEKLYKILGFFWVPVETPYLDGQHNIWLQGPFCSKCKIELDIHHKNLECIQCNRNDKLEISFDDLREKATKIYEAGLRESYEIISLDEPPTHVKVRDSDDKYFLAVKIGQKDGKRIGVVYFGEKSKEQSREDYSQIFIDLDDEQLRFDKSNKHPKDILLKFQAEFPNTHVNQVFKEKTNE